jgi:hypothetical protein
MTTNLSAVVAIPSRPAFAGSEFELQLCEEILIHASINDRWGPYVRKHIGFVCQKNIRGLKKIYNATCQWLIAQNMHMFHG